MISAGYIGGGLAGETAPVANTPFTDAQMLQLRQIFAESKPAPGLQTAGGDAVTLPEGPKLPDLDPTKDAQLIQKLRDAQVKTEAGKGKFLDAMGTKGYAEAANINKPWYKDPNSLNAITNLGSQVFGWLTNLRFFQMQEHFSDKAYERDSKISDNQVTMQDRLMTAAEKIEPRRIEAELEARRIHENAETERYERRLDSREREVSLQRLDNAFSMRGDYPNGNPFAAA